MPGAQTAYIKSLPKIYSVRITRGERSNGCGGISLCIPVVEIHENKDAADDHKSTQDLAH